MISLNESTSEGSIMVVSSDFLNSSNSDDVVGFMVIAYSMSNTSNLYGVANRRTGELHAEVTLTNFFVDEYRVSVFTLQNNGLPSTRSAATAQTVSNITGKNNYKGSDINKIIFSFSNDCIFTNNSATAAINSTAQNNHLIVTASHDGNCVRLNCTFKDTSGSQCVAIVTERSQKRSEYGLLKINVYNFTRAGDTASGCLPGLSSISDSNIDVFSFDQKNLMLIDSEMPASIKFIEGLSFDPPPPTYKSHTFNIHIMHVNS